LTSELFPIVSAPFVAAFGLGGAYVLPALGFLAAVWACARLAVALDPRRSPTLVIATTAAATPLVFYGLEFWEHALAVAVGALATLRLVNGASTEDSDFRGRALTCGLLFGIAILLRPEAGWYVVAVLVASRLLPNPLRSGAVLAIVVGVAIAMAPLEIYVVAHFGRLVAPHVANSLAGSGGWLTSRSAIVEAWLVNPGGANFWWVAPAMLLALVPLPAASRLRGRSFLMLVAGLDAALVVLTAPNDGGGQWGPRYLLFACIPLVLLATDVLQVITRRGVAGVAIVIVMLSACGWIQRTGYRGLRSTKVLYGHIVDVVARQVPANGYAVTDLWWLDQAAAPATERRTLLFASDADTGRAIVRQLDAASVPAVTVLRSRDESADLSAWSDGTCFVERSREELAVRGLVAIVLQRSCPGAAVAAGNRSGGVVVYNGSFKDQAKE
jgi:hypothetical protein